MSGSMKFTRQAGLVALVGALIGVVVSLLLNAAYSLTPDGVELSIPPWQPALEQIAGSALTFAPGQAVYQFYGRAVFLVLAAFTVGLYGLYVNQRAFFNEKPPRLHRWGYRLAMTGLVLALVGNIFDYWISIGEVIDLVAFVGGTVLGLLLQVIGFILLGISGLRSGSLPGGLSWALILWFPFSLALFALGMENLPATPLLGLSLAWLVAGVSMARAGVEERGLQKQSI